MDKEQEILNLNKTTDSLAEIDKPVENIVVPVLEEKVSLTKKFVETGRVNLSKKVNESIESFNIPLTEERIVVERIPKNEWVDTMPPASRYEGDVMIIPVLKEVAVVEKRIMLVEEIRVSTVKTEKTELREVVVKKEEVNITRTDL